MKITPIQLAVLVSVEFLIGCQAPVDPVPVMERTAPELQSPAEETGEARVEPVVNHLPTFMTITVIRIEEEKRSDPELLISMRGELVAAVGNQSYATFDLPVGTNTLTFNWEDTPLKFHEEIILDAEWPEQKYLSVVHKFDVPDIERKDQNIDYTMMETLALFELPTSYGKAVLKNLDPEMSYVFDYPKWWEIEE